MEELNNFNFAFGGTWQFGEDGRLDYQPVPEVDNILVYAIVENGNVRYVGRTFVGLDNCFYRFRLGAPAQPTNFRIHNFIINSLGQNQMITYYLAEFENLNAANVVKMALIEALYPIWNY